jgi:integrase
MSRYAKRPMLTRAQLPGDSDGIKVGFHALRRYRTETLRRARVPEDLIRLWLGHASSSITDLYAEGLHSDETWRREWVERAGQGFTLLNG